MNAVDLKALLDTRMKTGTVQVAVLDAIGQEMLDKVEARLTIAQQIKDPLLTTRPEDLRAKYGIVTSLTGAALAAEIDNRRQIGDISYVQTAVENYLKATYTFAGTPTVVVTPHRDLANAKFDDLRTATIRVPVQDDSSVAISLVDAGLIAEIDRVIPKWHYTIVNTTASRSAPYIKDVTSAPTKHVWTELDVFPGYFDVEASSEAQTIDVRAPKQLYWLNPTTQIEKADNILDGEDILSFDDVPSKLRVEASSTLVDATRVISEQIEVPSNVIGGFDPKDPNVDQVGITAIAAPERETQITRSVKDDLINQANGPSITMWEPQEEHPISVVQEIRLLTNDKKASDQLLGDVLIFHEYLDPSDAITLKIAGREIRVFAAPLSGGLDIKDNIVDTNIDFPEQFVAFDPTSDKLPPPTKEYEFARTFLDAPSNRSIDKIPVTLDQDQEFSFDLTITGASPGSQQNQAFGQASTGLTTVPVNSPSSIQGISNVQGFLPINEDQYYNVQILNAEPEFAKITIKQNVGGGTGNDFTEGLAQLSTRPSFSLLPNAGNCRSIAINVPSLANMFSFGSLTADLVDLSYVVVVHAKGVFDRIELQSGANATTQDTVYLEYSPDQTYNVTNTRIANMPGGGFNLGERRIKDLFDKSIVVHELKYDANKIPDGGVQLKAFATYEIDHEDNQETESVDVPTPRGFICDQVTINVKVNNVIEQLVVSLSDVDQIRSWSGTVFKTVRLDTVIDAVNTKDKSIASVILFYDTSSWTTDAIIKPSGHFSPWDTSLVNRRIEDLQSLTFNVIDELPLTAWRHTLPSIWDAFFTEKDTGAILDSPIGKFVGSGIIYYWQQDLAEDGQLVEVFVTYGNAGLNPAAKDMSILSVSVPEGHVLSFKIYNLTYEKLYYVDDLGVIRSYIDDYDIKTLEIHYDTNKIPVNGTFVEVWGKYGPPAATSNSAEELLSFSVRSEVKLKSVNFTGLVPKVIKYDTRDEGIIDSLAVPKYVSAVLVNFEKFQGNADKVTVVFEAVYLKNLKEVSFPVRNDWTVNAVTPILPTPPTLISIKEVWVEGEFDKWLDTNYGGTTPYRAQRIQNIRVFFYDADLSSDEGRYIDVNVDIMKIEDKRFGPFLPQPGTWASPSGQDEQFRIELTGVRVNRIDITGTTSTASPIRLIDRGYEKPYVQGVTTEPSTILLFYRTISSIKIYYDKTESVHNTHRFNALFDDATVWASSATPDDESLEIIGSNLNGNQLVVDLDSGSVAVSSIRLSVGDGNPDLVTVEYAPVSTSTVAQPYATGDVRIDVLSTVGLVESELLKIDTQIVRLRRILSPTLIEIDPLLASIPASSTVSTVGFDFGEPITFARCLVEFVKAGNGSVIARAIIPRMERRFQTRHLARNVLARDTTFWSSNGAESPTQETHLKLWFNPTGYFNKIDFAEEIESAPSITYLDAKTDTEHPVFLGHDVANRGSLYRQEDQADDPEVAPALVMAKSLDLRWDKLPRNPGTGQYQTRVIRCIPTLRYDAANSYPNFMLDGNIQTRWSSVDTANPSDVMSVIVDLGQVYPVDRILIISPSAGTSATAYYSLANQEYQVWGSIADIGAAVSTVTQNLTANVGPSYPPDTQVSVASTAGFDVGRFVNIRDSVSPSGVGEFRKVATISPTVLTFTPGLVLDYTTANSALVEQSNILCPGWYPPIVVGEACVGDHIRGPATFSDAFVMPLVEARFVRLDFTNLALEQGTGLYNVRLNHLDIFASVTVL